MRSRKLIVVCAIAAIGLAACSSSSKSASTATNPSGVTTTNGSSGNGSGGGSGGGDFCNKVKGDAQAFSSSGFTGKSAQDLKSVYSGLDAKLEQLKSDVPSAIKGDFDTYITFVKKFQKTLADANYDYTKLSPSDLVGLYSGNTGTALAHIGQYFAQNCHFSTPTT